MGKERAYFGTKIDKELVQRFKEYVLKKHGKLSGKLYKEMEKALEKYLNQHNSPEEGKK